MAELEGTSFFMNRQGGGLGDWSVADELLHHETNAEVDDPELTETQFLGFSVPEANLHSLNYLWAHPNVRLLTGGAWAWTGMKATNLHAELFDIRQFMPDDPIRTGDLTDYELPLGYRVKVLQPLEKINIAYDNPATGNAFDVTMSAIMPPAMTATGRHFDQAMRTEGQVTLRGRHHRVDGYTVRDRSWGEVRPEAPRPVPPIYWVTGVFSDDFAFHMMGFEHPDSGPIWKGHFPGAEAMTAINRGWLWLDGELTALESAAISARWDTHGERPAEVTVAITDTRGIELVLHGTITAACPWQAWSNVSMRICLSRWECEGRPGVAWGDVQAATWTEFVRACLA